MGAKFLVAYPKVKKQLQKVSWLKIIEKFEGYDIEVTREFAQAFDGVETEIGDIRLKLTESFIVEATKLPRNGEH